MSAFTLKHRRDGGDTPRLDNWGADSEYGVLRDVLLGPVDHYHWLETSSISRKSLRLSYRFDAAVARAQHAEMLDAYREAGVNVHMLPTDPNLKYQVFARDSSVMTPFGPIVTQMAQWWRRGEYAPVIQFYKDNGIPIYDMVTAGSFEGGDFMMLQPGVILCGYTGERSQEPAVQQMKGWLEAEGWEVKLYGMDPFFVHMDALCVMLAERLAAVCVDAVEPELVDWLKAKGIEIVDIPFKDAMELGCNVVALGKGRVLLPSTSKTLKEKCLALGLKVYDPDISMIAKGGGGVHCMCQPLRRDPV